MRKYLFLVVILINLSAVAQTAAVRSIEDPAYWVGKKVFDDNAKADPNNGDVLEQGQAIAFFPPSGNQLTVFYLRRFTQVVTVNGKQQLSSYVKVAWTIVSVGHLDPNIFAQPTFKDGTGKEWYSYPVGLKFNRYKESPTSDFSEYIPVQ